MIFGLVCCFIVYCVIVLSQVLRDIFHTPMARYSLFVLKVSLNANSLTPCSVPLSAQPGRPFDASGRWHTVDGGSGGVHCAEYKVAVEGKVIQRAECRPVENASYMALKRSVNSN